MSDTTTHDGDVSFIKALAELLRENDLTELRVKRDYGEDDSLDVRVSRHVHAVPTPQVHAPQTFAAAPAEAAGSPAPSDTPASPPTATDPARLPGAVTSPMVGTVYLQPEPGASSFVQVGSTVKEGDTLLIIEAMKTMNQIPSPRAGTVKRILVEDGGPVEYGAPLMIVE